MDIQCVQYVEWWYVVSSGSMYRMMSTSDEDFDEDFDDASMVLL
jgi:hypothetical protein